MLILNKRNGKFVLSGLCCNMPMPEAVAAEPLILEPAVESAPARHFGPPIDPEAVPHVPDVILTTVKLVVEHQNIINGDAVMSNGMAAWDFALSCSSFAPAWVTEVSPGTYQLDIEINDIKRSKILSLQSVTTNWIFKYMPEWRQARWNEYAILFEKQAAGTVLNDREAMIFAAMIDADDTAESTYAEVLAAMVWIHSCIEAHNVVESAIVAATDPVACLMLNPMPEYPAWVL